ncbi:MAG: double-strand break repair protein AddB [Neomegalonema sp.]|nr:double-strand break repair protein AddB [Neomegalonema sp.]
MSVVRLFDAPAPRVFAAPAGKPFAEALAIGALARLDAVGAPRDALADIELTIMTSRARRAVRTAFARVSGGAVLGPRMRGVDELGREDLEDPASIGPPPIEATQRLLWLTRLVRALLAAQPELGALVAAPQLAQDLAKLLDDAAAAGASLDDLAALETGKHAAHWEESRKFLEIVRLAWPAQLAEDGRSEPTARRRRFVEALARVWGAAPSDRVMLIAGAPTDDAAEQFFELIARSPQGAVILPGLDRTLDPAALETLRSGQAPDHPQASAVRFLDRLGLGPADIPLWTEPADYPEPPAAQARLRLLSQSLRPAPVTDAWRGALPELRAEAATATAGLTLLEAASPREEAMSIAIALREALETPGRTAALVTADRELARRVSAELQRWGVTPDESGGRPLSLTPPGVFFTSTLAAAYEANWPTALLECLKHPLAAAGHPRGVTARAARKLERLVFRRGVPIGSFAEIFSVVEAYEADQAALAAQEPPAQAEAPDAEEAEPADPPLSDWLRAVEQHFAPLMALARAEEADLTELFVQHVELAETLAADETGESKLYDRAAGQSLRAAVERIRDASSVFGPIAPAEYPALLGALLAEEAVREAFGRHARVLILGTPEARMQSADLVVLGGLNEGIWPRIPQPDAWLSRDMRAEINLPPLEAQIGLAAHDFFQLAASNEAILTRARKSDGAPTVPSRWLLRLTTLLEGADSSALNAMRERGERFIRLAGLIDQPRAIVRPAPRPAPRPPLDARPRQFSATEVETLIRDPYAIYAKKVLRLRELEPLEAELGARELGRSLHSIAERFVWAVRDEWPENAKERWDQIVAEELAKFEGEPTLHAVWSVRAAGIRDGFLRGERERHADGRAVALEKRGVTRFPTALGEATLTAFADRIDLLDAGGFAIYDYKTSQPPTARQQAAFAKQLALEAGILWRDGFEGVAAGRPVKLAFVRLSDGSELHADGDPSALAEEAVAGLTKLIDAYADPETPYLARLRPAWISFDGPYDHLARRDEWDGQEEEG